MLRARRLLRGWLVVAGLAVATIGVPIAAQVPNPPRLLAAILKARPEWRVLDPTTDLVGDYTIAQLEELDRWPPWIELDFDRDGVDDIAAVVVRRGAGNATEFTVVVVHGGSPDKAELVVPFRPQRIFGVSEGIKDDTVMPLLCADCDANIWYRWNGRTYEARLHAVGEAIRIGGEPGRRATLFTNPTTNSARTGEVPACARAQIQEVGGEAGQRWYRVEVVAPSFPRGWVPQQLALEGEECQAQ